MGGVKRMSERYIELEEVEKNDDRLLIALPSNEKYKLKKIALNQKTTVSNIMRGLIKDYIKANTPVKKLKKKIEC